MLSERVCYGDLLIRPELFKVNGRKSIISVSLTDKLLGYR
jgi:hypothetical protein